MRRTHKGHFFKELEAEWGHPAGVYQSSQILMGLAEYSTQLCLESLRQGFWQMKLLKESKQGHAEGLGLALSNLF